MLPASSETHVINVIGVRDWHFGIHAMMNVLSQQEEPSNEDAAAADSEPGEVPDEEASAAAEAEPGNGEATTEEVLARVGPGLMVSRRGSVRPCR